MPASFATISRMTYSQNPRHDRIYATQQMACNPLRANETTVRARAETLFNERALREGLEIDRVVFDALVVQRARKGALTHLPTCGSQKFHPVGFARPGRITSRPRARNQGRSLSARGLLCSHREHRARRRVPRPTSKN